MILLPPQASVLRRIAEAPLVAGVALYMALSGIVWPLVRPLSEALARARFLARFGQWLENRSPYQALALLAVPVAVLEPLKVMALAWIAFGHAVTGTAALLVLHGISLLSTERLFSALLPKLLTIRWFAVLWAQVTAARDWLMRLVRASPLWDIMRRAGRSAADVIVRAARAVRRFAHRLRWVLSGQGR